MQSTFEAWGCRTEPQNMYVNVSSLTFEFCDPFQSWSIMNRGCDHWNRLSSLSVQLKIVCEHHQGARLMAVSCLCNHMAALGGDLVWLRTCYSCAVYWSMAVSKVDPSLIRISAYVRKTPFANQPAGRANSKPSCRLCLQLVQNDGSKSWVVLAQKHQLQMAHCFQKSPHFLPNRLALEAFLTSTQLIIETDDDGDTEHEKWEKVVSWLPHTDLSWLAVVQGARSNWLRPLHLYSFHDLNGGKANLQWFQIETCVSARHSGNVCCESFQYS